MNVLSKKYVVLCHTRFLKGALKMMIMEKRFNGIDAKELLYSIIIIQMIYLLLTFIPTTGFDGCLLPSANEVVLGLPLILLWTWKLLFGLCEF